MNSAMLSFTDLKTLEADQLSALASLHYATMPTLLSELGLPVLHRYYQLAQNQAGCLGFLATINGEAVGWAFGSKDPGMVTRLLAADRVWLASQLAKVFVNNPKGILLLAGALLMPGDNSIPEGGIELTYIGIGRNWQGKQLGRQVLDHFIHAAREAGYSSIILSVEEDNSSALHLYATAGFKTIRQYKEGSYHRRRMLLQWMP